MMKNQFLKENLKLLQYRLNVEIDTLIISQKYGYMIKGLQKIEKEDTSALVFAAPQDELVKHTEENLLASDRSMRSIKYRARGFS